MIASIMSGQLWRHKKRRTVYEVLTECASIQCSAAPEFEAAFEDDNWTVYRNVATGAIWMRPTEEFLDGRFELVANGESVETAAQAKKDEIERLQSDNGRLRGGVLKIQEFLSEDRTGDASFVCEALLAESLPLRQLKTQPHPRSGRGGLGRGQ